MKLAIDISNLHEIKKENTKNDSKKGLGDGENDDSSKKFWYKTLDLKP